MTECTFVVQVTIRHFSYFLSESEVIFLAVPVLQCTGPVKRLALGCLRPADW